MEKVPVGVEGLPVSVEETQVDLEKIPAHGKIIDITTPISPFTRTFPGDPVPAIERVCTLEKEGFLVSEKIGKERIYQNKRLYDLVAG